MKITKPVYAVNESNGFNLTFDTSTRHGDFALDFGVMGWVDTRYDLIKKQIPAYEVLLTQTDLIAHDDYVEQLATWHMVVLYFDGVSQLGASKGRLKSAMARLKADGYKCRYFASRETAEAFVRKYTTKIKVGA